MRCESGDEPRPDDTDGGRGTGEQQGAASHERGEDRVAERGLRRQHPPKVGDRYDDHLAGFDHPGGHEHAQTGEHVQLAQEPARAVTGEDALFAVGVEHDLDGAGHDHEEVVRGVPSRYR